MPIRILHIVDNIGMGGLQNGLANLLARLDPKRFEHTICGIRPVKDADMQPFPAGRARLISMDPEKSVRRIQVPAFARIIREVRPDIVHSRNWAAIEAVFAARWSSHRVIHSEHGIDSAYALREPKRRTWLRRLAFGMADRVFSVSYQLKDFHAERTGFPADRIGVIHNGVDQCRFLANPEIRQHAREALNFSPDTFCIGCVGNLTPVKAHITLLKAMDEFARTRQDWRIFFAGDGPEHQRLLEFVKARPGWLDRVHFLGRRTNVQELLNAMDVYVLPSLSEGICNSLLEAMATSLPVIVTAAGGNAEVVVDGVSGLLFPVGDARQLAERLISVRTRADFRATLGQQALRRVREEFSLDAMIQSYADLYESVAARIERPITTRS